VHISKAVCVRNRRACRVACTILKVTRKWAEPSLPGKMKASPTEMMECRAMHSPMLGKIRSPYLELIDARMAFNSSRNRCGSTLIVSEISVSTNIWPLISKLIQHIIEFSQVRCNVCIENGMHKHSLKGKGQSYLRSERVERKRISLRLVSDEPKERLEKKERKQGKWGKT